VAPREPIRPMSWPRSVPCTAETVSWQPCMMRSISSVPRSPGGCSTTGRWTGRRALACGQTQRTCRRRPASARLWLVKWGGTAISSWTRSGLPPAHRPSAPCPLWRRSGSSGGNNSIAVPSRGWQRYAGGPRRSNRRRPCASPHPTSSQPATARNATRNGWARSCTSARPVSHSTPL
jgi:hypothetical protein